MITARAVSGNAEGIMETQAHEFEGRRSYPQITTKYHVYLATTIFQPNAIHADATASSGIRSTMTPAHLSMLGTRNGVRRVNLVWSANRYAGPPMIIFPR